MPRLLAAVLLLTGIVACGNFEKEVTIDLPAPTNTLTVECFLQPGKPYRLLLTRTRGFYEPLTGIPLEDSATVVISHNGTRDTLRNGVFVDFETGKFYNYQSNNIVPEDYDNDFFLNVTDRQGRVATSRTRMVRQVPIDSLEYRYNRDSLAYLLTTFTLPEVPSYYRFTRYRSTLTSDSLNTDFSFEPRFLQAGEQIQVGSSAQFRKGDTIIVRLSRIDQAYYNYRGSAQSAISSNGNPFGTPATVRTNITGGTGIFTTFQYTIRQVVLR